MHKYYPTLLTMGDFRFIINATNWQLSNSCMSAINLPIFSGYEHIQQHRMNRVCYQCSSFHRCSCLIRELLLKSYKWMLVFQTSLRPNVSVIKRSHHFPTSLSVALRYIYFCHTRGYSSATFLSWRGKSWISYPSRHSDTCFASTWDISLV